MSSILVCEPDFFNVNYEINSWMSTENKVDGMEARRQWDAMISCLVDSGARIEHIQPDPDFPDMVFTANAGLVRGNRVVLSNFRHEERRGERDLFKQWFLDRDYDVIELPEDISFEGAGDAMFFNNVLFMGCGSRTNRRAHPIIAEALGVDYVSCDLVNPYFYHLDTCLFTTDDQFVYYDEAFTHSSLHEMLTKVIEVTMKTNNSVSIHPVNTTQAKQFICNSIKVKHRITTPAYNHDGIFSGSQTFNCDMSEFIKSGGAVKCLTLEL
jgi:N-dimethylarginine dimethylaminohydrolase